MSVELLEQRLRSMSSTDPDRLLGLNYLIAALEERYIANDSIDDLNRSIEVMRECLHLVPEDVYVISDHQNILGNALAERSERTKSLEDLNEAISLHMSAEKLASKVDSTSYEPHRLQILRAMCLGSLGSELQQRYDFEGNVKDLDESILNHQAAVECSPADHPNRALYCQNLADALGARFKETRVLDHLNSAVKAMNESVALTATGDPNEAKRFVKLGDLLLHTFEATSSTWHLNEAIAIYQNSVECTKGSRISVATLDDLGVALRKRYELFRGSK